MVNIVHKKKHYYETNPRVYGEKENKPKLISYKEESKKLFFVLNNQSK